ncbi:hypothetical protein [Trujillonella endophytica]|uniref:Cobyrinic acid a,c-diamide synthase n=1 Tax=Trujillonella endophytica TaxID=673521 RepID=A0A1H8T781_9ACTN|nr:hypothetical protein [Trujillella endophytica]SEO86807.1 hypothetical protein SAMN05660991_02119 [Trujillella endophytica]
MTRRPVLPGASELFRRTDTPPAPEVTELPSVAATTTSPALRGQAAAPRRTATVPGVEESMPGLTLVPAGADADPLAAYRTSPPAAPALAPQPPRTRGKAVRTERTKHDEKITVYISADELLELESARLTLRGQHGVAADRGRIVREAIAVLLADLAESGEDSVLVRRLKGR